jgi:hypothetical protein
MPGPPNEPAAEVCSLTRLYLGLKLLLPHSVDGVIYPLRDGGVAVDVAGTVTFHTSEELLVLGWDWDSDTSSPEAYFCWKFFP